MNFPSPHRLKSLCLYAALPATFMTGVLFADDLDDLLTPADVGVKLVDDSATEAWTGVVDAFRRNDLAKAKVLGTAFLAGDHKTSPYQLLGVQVMLDLANAENPTVTRDVGLSVEMKRLMSERDTLRTKYANLQRVSQDAEALINKLTNNRTQAVQAGTAAYRECTRAAQQIQQAGSEMAAMTSEIETNKDKVGKVEVGANQNLKNDTMMLLDMLTEAGEIEAAFAIANVYIRVSGSDLDIAKKQQDVIRLREIQTKATSIAKVIEGKQKALIDQKRYWEALSVGEQSLSKVSQAGDKDLARLVTAKLSIDPLSIRRTVTKATSESGALRELARVDALKSKSMLKDFRSKYPDFPDMDTLSMAVEGERSGEMKGKVADLIKSVEDLADNDPKQAREILDGLSPDDIDPIDRRALETRISNAARKLYLAAEAARNADTKEKIAELLNSVETLADADPQRARETLDGLKLEDIDPVKRKSLEIRITNAERKLFLAAEATRSADTKKQTSELLNNVEELAEVDPKKAREILGNLKSQDIDPMNRAALETRISTAERKIVSSSIGEMESTLSEVKSKLGGEVIQILTDARVKTESSLSLTRRTQVASEIKVKIDSSAELPEVRAALTRLATTISAVTALQPSVSQMTQINGIKAEVEVLRSALK